MFARKLKALGYHSPNDFDVNGKVPVNVNFVGSLT